MTKSIIKRCVWISFGVAVIASILSSTILVAPSDGAMVPDFGSVEASVLEHGSETEINEHLRSIPMKQLSGFERFLYAFSHPQAWHFWWRAVFTWFVGLLVATLSVSFLNEKST